MSWGAQRRPVAPPLPRGPVSRPWLARSPLVSPRMHQLPVGAPPSRDGPPTTRVCSVFPSRRISGVRDPEGSKVVPHFPGRGRFRPVLLFTASALPPHPSPGPPFPPQLCRTAGPRGRHAGTAPLGDRRALGVPTLASTPLLLLGVSRGLVWGDSCRRVGLPGPQQPGLRPRAGRAGSPPGTGGLENSQRSDPRSPPPRESRFTKPVV